MYAAPIAVPFTGNADDFFQQQNFYSTIDFLGQLAAVLLSILIRVIPSRADKKSRGNVSPGRERSTHGSMYSFE
jgi:hypothetical protein